jgi:hypothetical protein
MPKPPTGKALRRVREDTYEQRERERRRKRGGGKMVGGNSEVLFTIGCALPPADDAMPDTPESASG